MTLLKYINIQINKLPILKNILRKIYYSLIIEIKIFLENKYDLKSKYWTKQKISAIKGYWVSRSDQTNYYLLEKLSKYKPSSILEIGCNSGNRLFLIAKKMPNTEICGIDINPLAVKKGNEWLKKENIANVSLRNIKAENLVEFEDNSFDIVFSWAVMIYIRPKIIKKVLSEMSRIARKYIILIEMHGKNEKLDPDGTGNYYPPGNWKRDYIRLFRNQNIDENRINIEKVPKNIWDPSGGGAFCIQVKM